MPEAILVVDDDHDILTAARLLLKRHFGRVVTSNEPARIPELMAATTFDVVLLDMNFVSGARSGREGLSWLARILEADADAVVVLMTAYSAVETAVEAMKLGAFDFVAKPWQNEKLIATVRAAVRHRASRIEATRLEGQNRELAADTNRPADVVVGSSPAMRRVFELVARCAPTDANVLVLGENGTGKEVVAREIHRLSGRAAKVFLSVDLGSVAESLVPSELFGHRKGSFTGATEHRVGRFQAADGGTLFLDELGNIPRPVQSKLLTALERREVVPVGANAPVPIDVRVISATNAPRAEVVDDALFRQDLLYRLNTVEIVLPPLRERPEDIPTLAAHFLQIYARKYGRAVRQIADDARAAIVAYPWPGNVRALRHAIERALILCDGDTLRLADFPLPPVEPPRVAAVAAAGGTLAELERQAIAQALARHAGNVTYAAQELGITRTSLYRRMEKHGL
ncbi:MAG: sigma-54-dependent Fis family transcriptional regulator [Kofleriaceae bacterium]|nr:sigma-54-dependent Fis family transcriptional regulator [Myxococcales bacterium]MCB9565393.1 sigma-54-dependent Fis family transcriptional regulator [Kofleriaceae bacterium]